MIHGHIGLVDFLADFLKQVNTVWYDQPDAIDTTMGDKHGITLLGHYCQTDTIAELLQLQQMVYLYLTLPPLLLRQKITAQ